MFNPALSLESFNIKRKYSQSPCPLASLLDNEDSESIAQHRPTEEGKKKKEDGGQENDRKAYAFAFLLRLFRIISMCVKQLASQQINGLMIQGNVELGS